jgi:hypothetical protein
MEYPYILSTITVIIGVCVTVVAYQQYRLGKEKLKLDLFEKRFAVYKGVQIFLTHVMSEAKVDLQKFFEFRGATQDAVFLFESDIPDFIKQIDKKALELKTVSEKRRDLPRGEEKSRLVQQESKLLEWLIDQLPRLKEAFSPYLKFKVWR